MHERERQTLRYSYAGEIGRGIFVAMCTEFALLVAVSHFGVSNPNVLWLLSSAPFLGMLIAVFSVAPLTRHRKKTVILVVELLSYAVAIAAAASMNGIMFACVMGVSIALSSVAVPLVSGIYGENFDKVIRGRAVGRLQAIRVGTAAFTAALVGAVLSWDTGYFRIVLVVVALLSAWCSSRAYNLPEERPVRNERRPALLHDLYTILRRDRAYAYLQAVWFIIGFCNLWLIPLRVLHLVEIGMDDFSILLATTGILNITQVITLRFWGHFLYRMNFAVYRSFVALLFIAGMPIFFYGTTLPVVCLGAFLWGTGLAGGSLSWRLVGTFFTTPSRLPVYMSIHTFFCGIRGLLGPYLALQLHAAFSAQAVANISVGGNILTLFMFVPMYFIMRRRTAHLDTLEAEQNAA